MGGATSDRRWPQIIGGAVQRAKHSPWLCRLKLIIIFVGITNVVGKSSRLLRWVKQHSHEICRPTTGMFLRFRKRLTSRRYMVPFGWQHHSADLSLPSRGGDEKVRLIHWQSWNDRMASMMQEYIFVILSRRCFVTLYIKMTWSTKKPLEKPLFVRFLSKPLHHLRCLWWFHIFCAISM